MLKHRRENRLVNCLLCWTCGGRMGPNHSTFKDAAAWCGICGAKNPLGNLRRLPLMLVNDLVIIKVAFTQNGTAAHALHWDESKPLGPWIKFKSGEVLERALVYLGMTPGQLLALRETMSRGGQGISTLTLKPRKKNLLRIDYNKL